MWLKLGQLLAYILLELFEPLFKLWREPPEVRQVGGDAELKKDIDNDITNSINKN